MKGITLLEVAKINCILMKKEPTPENIEKAYLKLREAIREILRSTGKKQV